ncbi:EamA family transporter [Scytonema sp. NUACC21]
MFPTNNWLFFTLSSLALYGLWGFFSKLATNYIEPKTALVYEVIGAVLVGLVLLSSQSVRIQADAWGIFYGILVGVSGTLATFCFFIALTKGSSSITLPLTSLYPIVTILLSVFLLQESLSLKQGIGILLALVALKQGIGILLALVAIVLCSLTD